MVNQIIRIPRLYFLFHRNIKQSGLIKIKEWGINGKIESRIQLLNGSIIIITEIVVSQNAIVSIAHSADHRWAMFFIPLFYIMFCFGLSQPPLICYSLQQQILRPKRRRMQSWTDESKRCERRMKPWSSDIRYFVCFIQDLSTYNYKFTVELQTL